MLSYCWPAVSDTGPTLTQHWVKVSCSLGWSIVFPDLVPLSFNPLNCLESLSVYWRSRGCFQDADLYPYTVKPASTPALKVIYHPLYGMNNYVLIWGDWLSCDPLKGSHDSRSPHIRKHLCPILWQL